MLFIFFLQRVHQEEGLSMMPESQINAVIWDNLYI